jgi:nucleotide-binding universal stress UspA family protein
MKKILIPIDFAASSVRAIKYAEAIFATQEAELVLLHIVTDSDGTVQKKSNEFAEFELLNLVSSKIPYSFTERRGSILGEVQQAIHDIKPALVVIGLEGGSLSKAFLKLTDCPVILVPKINSSATIKNIAYANDFLNIKESSALKPLLQLAQTFAASVHIIHVNRENSTLQDSSEDAIEYYLNPVKHEYFSLNSEDIVGAIQRYINDKKIDVLTLLLRDHGTNDLHTKGKLVEQLVNNSSVPILSLI